MGRKHSTNHNLPNGMRARKRHRANGKIIIYYYYESRTADGKRREIPLGTDYVLAIQQWAKLEHDKIRAHDRATYNQIATRYKAQILPTQKIGTQQNKHHHFKNLDQFFDNAPLDEITPQHIRQYLDWRREAPQAANNEIATFSNLWNHAREWGYTDRANPTQGIKKYKIGKRDIYIENELYELVYHAASQPIRDLMDIAYLIGQRPIDIVKIHAHDIKDGILNITQQKTGAQLRFQITGELHTILDRLSSQHPNGYLFHNAHGKVLTSGVVRKQFADLRRELMQKHPHLADALSNFQFRDLRAKSATDIFLANGISSAQQQLGHTTPKMTQTYVRKVKVQQPLFATPKKLRKK